MKNKPPIKRKSMGRNIPGFILQLTRKDDGVSPTDKFYLAVIHQFPQTPSNGYMAKRVGCGETKESARQHINKLESLGLISNNHRNGKRRKITLNVSTDLRIGVHPNGITIDTILMKELYTCPLRLVAAVEIGFSIASELWSYTKIGMSKRAYRYNLDILEYNKTINFLREKIRLKRQGFESTTDKVLSHDLLAKTTSKPEQLLAVSNSDCTGVKRIGKELISRDINKHTLDGRSNQKYNPVTTSHLILADQMKGGLMDGAINPMINDSQLFNDCKQEIPLMTQSEITHLKNSRINTPVKSRNKKPIIKTRKNNPLVKASVEMSMIFQNYPLLTRHRIGSTAHSQAEKVIRGLKNGLCTEFSDYLNVIIEKGIALKLKRSEIVVAYQKKFTLKERKSIYQKFNDLLSPEYWPKEKKYLPRCLWDALSHTNKYSSVSWLMWFILKDPKHLEKAAIVDMDYEAEMIVRRWSPTPLQNTVPELKRALGMLNKYYYGEFLTPYYDRDTVIGGQWGTWEKYLNGMLNFFDERYSTASKNPGWFKPHSKPIKAWEREMLRFSAEIEKQTFVSSMTGQTQEYQYA